MIYMTIFLRHNYSLMLLEVILNGWLIRWSIFAIWWNSFEWCQNSGKVTETNLSFTASLLTVGSMKLSILNLKVAMDWMGDLQLPLLMKMLAFVKKSLIKCISLEVTWHKFWSWAYIVRTFQSLVRKSLIGHTQWLVQKDLEVGW